MTLWKIKKTILAFKITHIKYLSHNAQQMLNFSIQGIFEPEFCHCCPLFNTVEKILSLEDYITKSLMLIIYYH